MSTRFEEIIISMYGQQGQAWLNSLPDLVSQLAKTWNLSDLQLMSGLSYNYVLGGMQGTKPIALKIGLDAPALQQEAGALKHFAGHGCVPLLNQDLNNGAVLLERIVPGTPLKTLFPLREQESLAIVCQMIKNLHSTPPPEPGLFPSVADVLTTLDKNWNLPAHHLNKARKLRDHLLATSANPVPLHGDLHHSNILLGADNQWLAIDPKGVMGEPAFEVGKFIRSPHVQLLEQPNAMSIIESRSAMIAQHLGFDEQRMRDWTYVQAVLAACWMAEDKLDPTYFIAIADLFYQM